ncbi:hypothetical protein [Roseomonas sp. CECT 9278]|uniref:hypothetical protein n=1 Tax=Roseomonas sp. CECT 9278 TaxID=2845823 RepID=UPI001E57F0D0|nr:hypothetical protein [Roseomonas sp. CECT 9278]CAH0216474.1 hypothetical protein ROS9278_02297 [Roseomonas sp. CECT 9278]
MDGLDIEIEGDSEPAVALALLKIVMRAEGKDEGGATADWILSTYGRCLAAVVGFDSEAEIDPPEDDEDEDEDEAAEKTAA